MIGQLGNTFCLRNLYNIEILGKRYYYDEKRDCFAILRQNFDSDPNTLLWFTLLALFEFSNYWEIVDYHKHLVKNNCCFQTQLASPLMLSHHWIQYEYCMHGNDISGADVSDVTWGPAFKG